MNASAFVVFFPCSIQKSMAAVLQTALGTCLIEVMMKGIYNEKL